MSGAARVASCCLASVLATAGCSADDPVSTAAPLERAVDAGVGVPATSQVGAQLPRVLELPSGARLNVLVGTTDSSGALSLPARLDQATWWRGSSRLGDPFGAVVIAAHVDSFAEGIGPIAEILAVTEGARIRLLGRHLVGEYEVVSRRFVPRAELSAQAATLSFSGDRRLVLITCGGAYDAAAGGYQDNVVVVARQTALDSLSSP